MSEKKIKILALVPCFNEERTIRKVLTDFPSGVVDEIVVIDDASTDNSPREIQQGLQLRQDLKITVLTHLQRRKAGFVVREAIDYARKRNYDLFTLLAGNGKDDPGELSKILEPILKKNYDYVQGSRFLEGGSYKNLPLRRKFLIKCFGFLFYLITTNGKRFGSDATNGFRAYKLSLFDNPNINIHQSWLDHYEMEIYIHYKALTLGYKWIEVGVKKDYPFTKGYSKIRPFIDWISILRPLILLKLGLRK